MASLARQANGSSVSKPRDGCGEFAHENSDARLHIWMPPLANPPSLDGHVCDVPKSPLPLAGIDRGEAPLVSLHQDSPQVEHVVSAIVYGEALLQGGFADRTLRLILLLQTFTDTFTMSQMHAEVGDKVRLKNHRKSGQRGIIERLSTSTVMVRITETNELLQVTPVSVTNYSLAARKAWEKMPDKRVGRPKGSVTTDRVSVTLRVDREIWEQFQLAEATGFIPDRTATINRLLRQELKKIEQRKRSLSLREEG